MVPIAPSTYFRRKSEQADPAKRSARAIRDEVLKAIIQRIWREHDQAYGAHKVWKQMGREGLREARCRVRRLMRELGLRGVVRGRAWTTTTQADPAAARPADLVNRHFRATRPNQLWVSDFTYVATWSGFVYVAFVIDVFARRIVGWRVSSSLRTDFVLDALEQAIYARCDDTVGDLVHHSDRGSQYLSMRYTERLARRGHRAVGGQPWRFLRQRPRRIGDRALQSGGDSSEGTVADARGGRIRHAHVGGLVQSSTAARSDRLHAAGRVRRRATMSRPPSPDSHNSLSHDPGTVHTTFFHDTS